ncbi:MAG: AraC family transcriptional regulator [Myxococcota bacterium]|nr:AraC family transcriptional regulator [Myxococcota bacterium]
MTSPRKRVPIRTVSVLSLRPMLSGFERLGLERSRGLEVAGLDEETLANPDARVGAVNVWHLWNEAQQVTGDSCIGLHLAQELSPNDFGLIGYILASSATVREALKRLRRFHRLLADSVQYSFPETESGFILRHELAGGAPVFDAMSAYVLAVPVKMFQQSFGQVPEIEEVRLSCQRPGDVGEYERFFNAPLMFEAGENAITISILLDATVPTADPALNQVLEGYAKSLIANAPSRDSAAGALQEQVVRLLPEGVPSASRAGEELGMSERSLRRRLREEGTSFSEIVTRIRRQLALKHLDSADLTVSEIAYLLGFSDPTAFHRAFRSWEACTPLEYRHRKRQEA